MNNEKRMEELKYYVKALHDATIALGYATISEYTLNQILMLYKKEHQSPGLPTGMINDINNNIKQQVDDQFKKIENNPFCQKNFPTPFIPAPPVKKTNVIDIKSKLKGKKK